MGQASAVSEASGAERFALVFGIRPRSLPLVRSHLASGMLSAKMILESLEPLPLLVTLLHSNGVNVVGARGGPVLKVIRRALLSDIPGRREDVEGLSRRKRQYFLGICPLEAATCESGGENCVSACVRGVLLVQSIPCPLLPLLHCPDPAQETLLEVGGGKGQTENFFLALLVDFVL